MEVADLIKDNQELKQKNSNLTKELIQTKDTLAFNQQFIDSLENLLNDFGFDLVKRNER